MDYSFPNFLVVGAAKSGTTSLYNYLKQHPEVYMSPIKETNYFSTDIDLSEFSKTYKRIERQKKIDIDKYVKGPMDREIWGAYIKNRNHYVKLFKHVRDETAIGEVSNSYLYSKVAPYNIKSEIPDVRIIMILRNPIERIFSHYLADLRDGKTKMGFRDAVTYDFSRKKKGWGVSALYMELGMYYEQVKRYLSAFSRKNIKIYTYDYYKEKVKNVLSDLCAFLNIDRSFYFDTTILHNKARIPKYKNLLYYISKTGIKRPLYRLIPQSLKYNVKNSFFTIKNLPELSNNDKNFLIQFYKEDIIKLSDLIEEDLSHWLE